MYITSKSGSACIYEGDAQTDAYFVDVIAGVNVIECQNDEMELLKKVDGHLSDVFVVGDNIYAGVYPVQRLLRRQSFRFAFVLFFEQELPV